MNIRNRLTLQFMAICAVILAVAFVGVYYVNLINTRAEFYDRLEDRAYVSARFFFSRDELTKEKFSQFQTRFLQSLPDEVIQIYDESFFPEYPKTQMRYRIKDAFLKKVQDDELVHSWINNKQLVGINYKDNSGNFLILVTALDKYGNSKLETLRLAMLIAFVLSLMIIYFSGRFFAKKALEPMEEVVHQVQNITASNLNLRVSKGNGKDEIAELAITFNKMLEGLEHAFEMQRTFVSNASHELRTPLTIIIGEIEVLLSRSRTELEYRVAVEAIRHEAEQLNMLVNTLLSFAQAGDKEKDQLVEPIRLDELLLEIAEETRRKHPRSDIRIEMNDLPADPDKMSIPGNYPLLQSALSNIVDNAVKFSTGKPVICRFSVSTNTVTIDIIDQGIGISEKDLKSLFQPFFRASNARAFHGHGLGLALSRRIVRLHGGDIFVSSQEDIGTEFRLEFTIVYF